MISMGCNCNRVVLEMVMAGHYKREKTRGCLALGGGRPGHHNANEIESPPHKPHSTYTRPSDKPLTIQESHQLQLHALALAPKHAVNPFSLPIGTQVCLSYERSQRAYKLQKQIIQVEWAIARLARKFPNLVPSSLHHSHKILTTQLKELIDAHP